MAKKMIYKSVIMVEVLSDLPIQPYTDLAAIAREITEGDCSGKVEWKEKNSPIVGKQAVNVVKAHGSDPEFFMMDENGNELDY